MNLTNRQNRPGGEKPSARVRTTRNMSVVWVALLFLAGTGMAQDELPDGDGKKLFLRSCTSCHGASMIIGEGHGKAEWATTVATMAKRGAQGTEDELP